jgi:hypothetical protein
MELLIVMPLLLTLFLAAIEFGLIWSANQRVKVASVQGCRVATLPGACADDVKAAVKSALGQAGLAATSRVTIEGGVCSGDLVAVDVVVPMNAASPDMLRIFGFSLRTRQLTGRTVMRME